MLMGPQERTCLVERALNLESQRALLIPRGVTSGKSDCISEPALGWWGDNETTLQSYGLRKMLMTYWYEKAGYKTMCPIGSHGCELQKNG